MEHEEEFEILDKVKKLGILDGTRSAYNSQPWSLHEIREAQEATLFPIPKRRRNSYQFKFLSFLLYTEWTVQWGFNIVCAANTIPWSE